MSVFRDPDFFKSLLTNVFPYLQSYPTINVWSAGCSFGEETYSLVLLKEMDLLCKSRLYATDISTKALDKSKKESTLLMTLKNIPLITFHVGKESLNQYFVSDGQNQLSAQT
jgi:chemotaxis protein methyltransferase CheR